MKFWQKIFLGTILIFIVAFDIGAYALITHAYNYNRQRETENGIREQSVILSSVTSRIASAESIYSDAALSTERLTAVSEPLADYYKPQGVLLALYNGESAVCSDLPDFDKRLLNLESALKKNTMDNLADGKRYIFVASKLPDYPHLTLIYARDVSSLDDFRNNISRVFMLMNAAVLVFMGIAIYLLLRHMTRPIAKLNKMSTEIASGALGKRVVLNRTDELGHLGDNFNRMADSVEKTMARLTEVAEDRQQFIDDLTHEMKTPLTSILGYAEYLQNAKSTEDERMAATAYLHEAALRLKNLSVKLLELAYLRGEETELRRVDVSALFASLAGMMTPTLTSRRIRLDTQTKIKEINGDETLLLSMLTNLTENAAKASKPGDTITVRAFETEFPIIEVADMGHGMERSEIEKITEPFYRVDKSRSRKFGGVGLGLSIVSQIADLHGAKLEIESSPGKGTTVWICFTTL